MAELRSHVGKRNSKGRRGSAVAMAIMAITIAPWGQRSDLASTVGAIPLPWFTSIARRASSVSKQAPAYPNLSLLEDMIFESCNIEEGDDRQECMQVYDKLLNLHFISQKQCDIDSLHCVVLDVLDRACDGIRTMKGVAVLWQLREAVDALQANFQGWEAAFDAAVTKGSEHLTKSNLKSLFEKSGLDFPDMTIDRLFMAADANYDGVLDREEFSNFMLAGAFAAEPLASLKPKESDGGSYEDVLRWAANGRVGFRSMDGPIPKFSLE